MEKKSALVFEDHGHGMVFTARGVVSGKQLLERNKAAYSSEISQQLRYQIMDLRDLERLDMSTTQLQELAALDRQVAAAAKQPMRVALIANHELTEGLARIYCAHASSPTLDARIFPELDAARAWARHLS